MKKVKRRILKKWVVNVLVSIEMFLIIFLGSECENIKLFTISKIIGLIMFIAIALLLKKYGRIEEF